MRTIVWRVAGSLAGCGRQQYFNGLQALLTRPNAGSVLLQTYRTTPADAAREQQDVLAQSDYARRLIYLELILAQPKISAMLTSQERKLLIETALQQKQAKENLGEPYAGNGSATTTLVADQTLQREQSLHQGK